MKEISIQDLKAKLSAAVAEAESGHIILITRHNRPVARLAPADVPHIHVGKSLRRRALKPLLKQATRGRYLTVLLDDRRGVDDV
jgi:prevent-host-death family protein